MGTYNFVPLPTKAFCIETRATATTIEGTLISFPFAPVNKFLRHQRTGLTVKTVLLA